MGVRAGHSQQITNAGYRHLRDTCDGRASNREQQKVNDEKADRENVG